MNIKIGFGYDVHQLVPGDNFRIGGIDIPHTKRADGHSDADVLIHAVCDALLGAASLRDIGHYFPNTDEAFHLIDSTLLLKKVHELIREKGFEIGNIDATVVLEQPKISPHVVKMQIRLTELLQLEEGNVGIKATTNEKMGFAGREEGVAAYAVALIYRKE